MHWLANALVLVGCAAALADGAKILALFFAPSHSHQIVYNNLMEELNERGHSLTIMTPLPLNNATKTNYKEIDVSYSLDYFRKKFDFSSDSNKLLRWFPEVFLLAMIETMSDLCHMYLEHPSMREIRESGEEFDLLILEWGMAPCMFPYLLQVRDRKMIGMTSFSLGTVTHMNMGSTSNPAYIPEVGFPYSDRMTFPERLRTAIFQGFAMLYCQFALWFHQGIAQQYFGPDIPTLSSLETEVSLVLTNNHFSTQIPRPYNPNIIPIGGPPFQLLGKKPNPLPKDIQEFLDSAKDGVIYFSLGSNVKSSTMPESKRALFLDAFRQIKQKVLWKWETDDLPGKPDNVKLGKWLPQTDILAHPNVKGFITQGGLQSMGEATHYHVPMVVIPFFADQELNAKKLVSVGVAIRLDFETITTQEILDAVNQIIHNSEYKENVKKYAALTNDQPQSPMERAVWWTEYVIRHKGARHLRSPVVDMPWYQYFLLDVIAFLLLIASVSSYLSYIIARAVLRKIASRFKKQKKE